MNKKSIKSCFAGAFLSLFLVFPYAFAAEPIEVSPKEGFSFNLAELQERPISKEVAIENNTTSLKELFIMARQENGSVSNLLNNIIIEIQKKNDPQIIFKSYLNELFEPASTDNVSVIVKIPAGEKISLWITASIDPAKKLSEEDLKFNFIFGFLGNILEESAAITPQGERISNVSLNSLGNETVSLAVNISPSAEKSFFAKNFNNNGEKLSLFAEADRYFVLTNIYFISLASVIILILIYFYFKPKKVSIVKEKIEKN